MNEKYILKINYHRYHCLIESNAISELLNLTSKPRLQRFLVTSHLSAELIRILISIQRIKLISKKGPRLSNLLSFLRKEVMGKQRVKILLSGFEISTLLRGKYPEDNKIKNKKSFMRAIILVTIKEPKCIFLVKSWKRNILCLHLNS